MTKIPGGSYCIGSDIGGTKVNIGVIHPDGHILAKEKIASVCAEETLDAFLLRVRVTIDKLIAQCGLSLGDIGNIGIGVPGTVDMKTGLVRYCPNLAWQDLPLGEKFQQFYPNISVHVIQDSWAAAIAEHTFGAGQGSDHLACVTLGTGIGCGVILNGKIFSGGLGCAGELGHIIVEKDGIPCNCGSSGCLERYASGNGIFAQAWNLFPEKFKGREAKAETVFELAYEGDTDALDLIDHSVQMLAIGLANMENLLSLEKIIISGGLCQHKELIVEPLKKYVKEYGYHSWTRQNCLVIETAQLGPDAPMIGAAIYQG